MFPIPTPTAQDGDRRYAGEADPTVRCAGACSGRPTSTPAASGPGQRSCQHKTVAPTPEACEEPVGGSAPPTVP